MKWKLVENNEMGDILAVVSGTFETADKKRRELEKERGTRIVIYQGL